MASRDCGKTYAGEKYHHSATGSVYKREPATLACGRRRGHTGPCGERYCRQWVFGAGNPPGGASCGNRPMDGSQFCRRHDPGEVARREKENPRPEPARVRLWRAERDLKWVKESWQREVGEMRERLAHAQDRVAEWVERASKRVDGRAEITGDDLCMLLGVLRNEVPDTTTEEE